MSPFFKTLDWVRSMIHPVTSPLHESRLLWLHDPRPKQSPRSTPRSPAQKENKKPVPRNNNDPLVPRNNPVIGNSDARA